MDRNLFSIERVEISSMFLRREFTRVAFAVVYKGVTINRFATREAAQKCGDDASAIRPDAQWAYDEALRAAGLDIPKD